MLWKSGNLLAPHLGTGEDLANTHSGMYCRAIAVSRVARVKFSDFGHANRTSGNVSTWKVRVDQRISTFRTLIVKLILGGTTPSCVL